MAMRKLRLVVARVRGKGDAACWWSGICERGVRGFLLFLISNCYRVVVLFQDRRWWRCCGVTVVVEISDGV